MTLSCMSDLWVLKLVSQIDVLLSRLNKGNISSPEQVVLTIEVDAPATSSEKQSFNLVTLRVKTSCLEFGRWS